MRKRFQTIDFKAREALDRDESKKRFNEYYT